MDRAHGPEKQVSAIPDLHVHVGVRNCDCHPLSNGGGQVRHRPHNRHVVADSVGECSQVLASRNRNGATRSTMPPVVREHCVQNLRLDGKHHRVAGPGIRNGGTWVDAMACSHGSALTLVRLDHCDGTRVGDRLAQPSHATWLTPCGRNQPRGFAVQSSGSSRFRKPQNCHSEAGPAFFAEVRRRDVVLRLPDSSCVIRLANRSFSTRAF